jgi:hypothetical protein
MTLTADKQPAASTVWTRMRPYSLATRSSPCSADEETAWVGTHNPLARNGPEDGN